MSTLKLIGLIGSLMLSATLVCAASMVLPALLTGSGSPALSDAVTFGTEAVVLLGLVIWLRSTLAAAHAHQR